MAKDGEKEIVYVKLVSAEGFEVRYARTIESNRCFITTFMYILYYDAWYQELTLFLNFIVCYLFASISFFRYDDLFVQ